MNNTIAWDKSRLRQLITTNDKAVERAILAIYDRQTQDEKQVSDTKHHNCVGFSAAHARSGSYYARWIRSGRSLTGRHLEKARTIALHYTGQLLQIIEEKRSTG